MSRRALLIGSQTHGLRGPNADVAAIDAVLADRAFVRRVLVDAAATRDGILAGLRTLVDETIADDTVFIYYSGHGGRIDNIQHLDDPDQPRTYACIIPFDHTREQFRGIFSAELSAIVAELARKTRNITVVLDCCHAEEQVMGDFIPRGIVVPWNGALQAHRDWLVAQGYDLGARAEFVESNPHAIRLAACKASQVAYEGVGADGVAHGLLTEALLHVLASEPDAAPPWRAIEALVRARVAARYPTQEPVVQGPADRLLFDTTVVSQRDVLTVESQGAEHYLTGGSLQGVTMQSRYLLMPLNANRAERALALAEAEVVEVFTDRARVVLGPRTRAAPPSGTRAYLFEPRLKRHPVGLEGLGEPLAVALAGLVAASPRLCLADGTTAPAMTIAATADGLSLRDRDGLPIRQPWPLDADAGALRRLLAHAEQLARVYDLLDLPAGEGPTSLQPAPTLRWGRVGDVTSVFLPSGGARLAVGDRIFVRVSSESSTRIYVSILGVGVDRSIRLLSGSEPAGVELRPGESYTLGQDDLGQSFGIPLAWPPDAPPGLAQPVALVAICTDVSVDLRSLESDATSEETLEHSADELLDPEGLLVYRGGGSVTVRAARYYRATLTLTVDPQASVRPTAPQPAPAPQDVARPADEPPVSDPPRPPRITPERKFPVPMLFISATPHGQQPLAHDLERQAIRDALGTDQGRMYSFSDRAAASRVDVIGELHDRRPGVFHISCHGEDDGLLLQDESGNSDPVPPRFLVDQIGLNPEVGLVTLSACDSDAHARAIAEAWQIDVVGVRGKIRQDHARTFYGLFYKMLAHGLNVASAFKRAVNAVPESVQAQLVWFGPGTFPAAPVIIVDPPSDKRFPFAPSNLDSAGVDWDALGDLDITALNTGISTDKKSIGGVFEKTQFKLVDQDDGSRIGVYYAKSVRVGPNASLVFEGQNAGALVARDTIKVYGKVDATPSNYNASAGGYKNDGSSDRSAGGPGGGAAGSASSGSGGGSYGGSGGRGAALPDSEPADPGKPYGNLELIPLRGGSAGGNGSGGAGGGAVQLVAGDSILVGPGGRICCGGGAGMTGGAAGTQQGHGGGSGGGLLLEALKVRVQGVVAANGGSAGSGHFGYELWGQPGQASDQPARGTDPGEGLPVGAHGSAGDKLDGEDGVATPRKAGGGGGGAGRIRINTASGAADITGTVSPSLGTPCATQGKLQRLSADTTRA